MSANKIKRLPRIVLVHGFNVSDYGAGSLDKLLAILPKNGFEVVQADYGDIGLIDVLKYNDNMATMLKGLTYPDDIVIGHSNGCSIIVEAARQGAKFKRALLFNPALQSDCLFPETISKIDVFFTRSDVAVRAARLLRYIPPFSFDKRYTWGQMGATGAMVADERVSNVDMTRYAIGHSGAFESPALCELEPIVKDKIKRA